MGLPIEKLIVATNENDILERVINTGEYKPTKVKPSLSPSMDVQIASNFERLLFDILNEDDKQVSILMDNLKSKGSFLLNKEQKALIKKNFNAKKLMIKKLLEIIKNFSKEHNFIIDPHTATAVELQNNKDGSEILILGTAHPYKFLDTIKMATSQKVETPKQIAHLMDKKKKKYDILENEVNDIKKVYIKQNIMKIKLGDKMSQNDFFIWTNRMKQTKSQQMI